jgi:hypothetical protein
MRVRVMEQAADAAEAVVEGLHEVWDAFFYSRNLRGGICF